MYCQTVNNDGRRYWLASVLLIASLALPGVALAEEAEQFCSEGSQQLEASVESPEPAEESGEPDSGPGDAGDSLSEQSEANEGVGGVSDDHASGMVEVTAPADGTQAAADATEGECGSPSASDSSADLETEEAEAPEVEEAVSPEASDETIDADPACDDSPECNETGHGVVSDAQTTGTAARSDSVSTPENADAKKSQTRSADVVLAAQVKQPAPLPSKAIDVKEGTYVIETNVSDEKVLDAAGTTPRAGSNVASYTYHASNNQRWIVRKDAASSWYLIYSAAGNLKLALGLAATKDNARNVGLVDPKKAGDAALWAFVKNGSWYNLINRAMPELLLTVSRGEKVDKTNIQLDKKSTNAKSQRFYLLSTKVDVKAEAAVGEAAYAVSPQKNKNVVAEVRGAKTTSGTNVWLYASNGKSHQKLYLERDAEGFYTIWVVGTRRVLATETASIIPGNNVVQRYRTDNTPSQKWALRKNADGSYTFVNKRTGLALGASSARQGGNLFGTRDDGYVSTRFQLKRTPLLSAGIVEIHPQTTSKVSLDVRKAATSGNAGLILWTDTDALNQRYELVKAGGTDLWRIRTASSGGWITDTGAEVRQQGRGSSAATKANTWRVTFKGGGYCLVNTSTGRALDMRWGRTRKGTSIIGYKPNGRDSQHFAIEKTNLIGPGTYFLRNGEGGYLDVEDDSPDEGARLRLKSKDGYLGQYFTVESAGDDIRIKNTYSDRYLMVNGSRKVVQGGRSKSGAQKWTARIEDGGRVSIVNVSSGKALDGSNSDAVKVASSAGSKAQTWKPVATDYHPFSGYLLRAVNRANGSSSRTGWLLVVDKSSHKVVAMIGGNGHWKPSRIMSCSVGAWSTPTVEGSFTVGSRGTSFGHGYTCWYWTQFYADYLFHSVLYNPGSKSSVQDGRLGMHISHGCVRMPINDAHWIYSTIPSGTRVLIYS